MNIATEYDNVDVVKELIHLGVDPNQTTLEQTSLTIAAHFNSVNVIKELINVGVDLEAGEGARYLVRMSSD